MKKTDLVHEVEKVTQTKKQAAMAIEIFSSVIKKTLKSKTKFSFLTVVLLVLLKEKYEKEEIQRLVKQSK
jgi:nucleoid DNA-binding protein